MEDSRGTAGASALTIAVGLVWIFFSAQTQVSLASAQSDGPDHADSLSTSYVSRVKKFTCHLQSGGTYIWTLDSCHLSVQLYIAAMPYRQRENEKFVPKTSACSALSVLICDYRLGCIVLLSRVSTILAVFRQDIE